MELFVGFSSRKHRSLAILLGLLLVLTPIVNADNGEDSKEEAVAKESTAGGGDADDEEIKKEPKEENDVLILTDDNFDDVVFNRDIILVEFYAPWCGHCKQLAPNYEKAAKRLKESKPPVSLAKVDATIEKELGTRFDVSGYPTIKWFKNGMPFDYDGPRDENGIVDYMKIRADPSWKIPPEAVQTLTKENFTEITEKEELVVVMFYAPWCGHCKRLHPEFEKAAQDLKKRDKTVVLAKVDATVEMDLGTKFKVEGYPTMKIFRKGSVYDYKGEAREQHGIVTYIEAQIGSASKELSSFDAVKRQIQSPGDGAQMVTVSFFDSSDDKAFKTYDGATNEIRDEHHFWHTFDSNARDFYKLQSSSIVAFTAERFQTQFEPKMHVLQIKDDTTASEIGEFYKNHEVPLVGEFDHQTRDKAYRMKRPLVLFFYTVDWTFEHRDATQAWRKKFAEVAKIFPQLIFAIANEESNVEMIKEFGFEESSEEINIGILGEKNKKYTMKAQEEYDSDEVVKFLKDFLKGTLKPRIVSQPVPKKQDGPVKVVVGSTFEKIVLDPKKDVLIELYAPWCGHCKKLEPVYKELAKKFKKEKNLVIAKMDASANDSPENYPSQGYPTIYFAPANGKQSPIAFGGDKNLEEMVKFVKEHATVSLGKSAKKDEL